MVKLKARGLKWLKGFHLIAVSCWVGGAVALLLLYFLKDGVIDGGVLYGINRSIHHVDMLVIVIPGALGCLVTGLIYSSFSPWGFFKHKWLLFKWIVFLVATLSGTFLLGPWETAMVEFSENSGIAALSDPSYLYVERMGLLFGVLQVLLLIILVFVSIFKPWKSGKRSGP